VPRPNEEEMKKIALKAKATIDAKNTYLKNFDFYEDLDSEGKNELKKYVEQVKTRSEEDWQPPQPSSDAKIWRYISFTQLLSILEREEIWFTNASKFEDPYEGMVPKPNIEHRVEKVQEIAGCDQDEAKSLLSLYDIEGVTSRTFVNCWNISRHESAALWEQYLESSQGVAVTSQVRDLREAILTDEDVKFGEIEYIDYNSDRIPEGPIPPLYHKRNSFEYENEFRVSLIPEKENNPKDGKYVPVDTGKLINEIYLPPSSRGWFFNLIGEVIETYDVDCELKESEILSSPGYGV